MSDDPFDKHYWRFADEFPDIYADDTALALWHRLVRLAGMSWPSAATLPYGIKRRVLTVLVEAELVFLFPANTFRIRGMDKERNGRSEHARAAANARWSNAGGSAAGNARSTAGSNAQLMPSRAEESRGEQSIPAASIRDALDGYYRLTARPPSKTVIDWLARLEDEYELDPLLMAMADVHSEDPEPRTFLSRVQTRLASVAARYAKSQEERRQRADAEYQRQERERTNDMKAVKLPPFAAIVKDIP